MSSWIDERTAPALAEVPTGVDAQTERWLRWLDLGIALVALVPLGLLTLALWPFGRLRAQPMQGAAGRMFHRWTLSFGNARTAAGWGRWSELPVVWNILAGDMSWVGPRARPAGAIDPGLAGLAALRPGLVSSYRLQQRVAVDFGSEREADLRDAQLRGVRRHLGLLVRALVTLWLSPPRVALAPRLHVAGVAMDNVDMVQALERMDHALDQPSGLTQQVCFVNPACVNIAARHKAYRNVLARAALVLPDGIGIKIAADVLGTPLRQNVNGTDLFPRLCDLMQQRRTRLFLLGGQDAVVQKVADEVQRRWPGIELVGYRNGFFGLADEGAVVEQVRASGAEVLLVARGVPVQDLFIDRHLHHLGVKLALGVGGLFDFVSGRIPRAPQWMRDSGLEWTYRLWQEPGRMWRRYVVGNAVFLARVVAQRVLGQRGDGTGAADEGAAPVAAVAAQPAIRAAAVPPTRVVLFATSMAGAHLPVAEDFPIALMPLGWGSFAERNLDQLADAGVREVDLVVNSRPEALRAVLGDGERWGMRLRWHLVKDALTPYKVLPVLGLPLSQRVVIGHLGQWIDASCVQALLQDDQVLACAGASGVEWAGWASLGPGLLAGISPHCDEASFAATLCSSGVRLHVLGEGQWAGARTAAELLNAQALALQPAHLQALPATWIRTPWGAHAPDAVVPEGAVLEGPALVGPRCYIGAQAKVGAGSVLCHDVVLTERAEVGHSIVLPHTLVGEGLQLTDCIVNAGQFHNVRLDARAHVAASDGLLLDVRDKSRPTTGWLARGAAAVLCLLAAPVVGLDALWNRVRGGSLRWTRSAVVVGRDVAQAKVMLSELRCPRPGLVGWAALVAHYGAWLDVLEGRRQWFGQRPRTVSQWYALGRDWQGILSDVPVGCFHMPAWFDSADKAMEAQAVADVYFAYQHGWAPRWRMLCATLRPAQRQSGV